MLYLAKTLFSMLFGPSSNTAIQWLVGGIAIIVGLLLYGSYKEHQGEAICKAQGYQQSLLIKDKQNEILLNRPNTATLFSILQSGTY